MGNTKKAIKSGVWYIVGSFISKGMVFIVAPIFNRIMSASEIGHFSNYSAWIAILTIVFTLDLNTSVTVARFDFKDNLDDFVTSALVLGSIITGAFFVVSFIFRSLIVEFTGFSDLEINIAFLYFLVCPAIQMLQVRNRIAYKYKLSTAITLLSSFASSILALLFVISWENKVIARIIGNYGTLILVNLVIYALLVIKAPRIRCMYWRYALGISAPMALHLLAGSILGLSDRIMISKMTGAENAGYYSVAYSSGMVVSILWGAINTAWSPWAYEQMDAEEFDELKKAQKILMLFWMALLFFILLLAPEILYVMGGKKYMTSLNVIPPVMAAYGINAIYTFYSNIEIYSKKQMYIARNTIIAAVINVVLNYMFIGIYGYMAAAFTTLIGNVALLVLHFSVVRKMGRSDWYDSKFNWSAAALIIVIMFLMMVVYNYPLIRYGIVGIITVSVLIFVIRSRKVLLTTFRARSIKPLISFILSNEKIKEMMNK